VTEGSDNPCLECGGICCSFRDSGVVYHGLESGQRYDSFVIRHDTSNLVTEDGRLPAMEWYIVRDGEKRSLAFHCTHRTEDGLCGIYEDRPGMCRGFECPVLDGEQTLSEFKDRVEFPDGRPADTIKKEVTERVNEILRRKHL
jgi:Fe-S-cluster containining protein